MTVEYRDILNFPGYRIGSDGSVWTCWRRVWRKGITGATCLQGGVWKQMRLQRGKIGHLAVMLRKGGKGFTQCVHRLVLEAFVGPCPEGMVCLHINGRSDDNRPENLRWGTPKENVHDQIRHGTIYRGPRPWNARLTAEEVKEIKALLNQGVYQYVVAERFRISPTAISFIHRGKSWKHID